MRDHWTEVWTGAGRKLAALRDNLPRTAGAPQHDASKLPIPERVPNVHDYCSCRGWGHDYSIWEKNGDSLKVSGHGEGIERGDYLVLESTGGKGTIWEVEKINYRLDPYDMWWAELRHRKWDTIPTNVQILLCDMMEGKPRPEPSFPRLLK